eukprot:CAMPEP_0196153546 /NCGR_PEP_ID=MMETSP0910-20130528/37357_1 /TAXON_ID=49265 /ORGANISM="Thalassiosira rotula, Strain GSO102" /LENGTH=53 /DNA_ID=CAMNT_0041417377 /DNA_START=450 /DNA_END=606 /DNA_ORIENTATION=-
MTPRKFGGAMDGGVETRSLWEIAFSARDRIVIITAITTSSIIRRAVFTITIVA